MLNVELVRTGTELKVVRKWQICCGNELFDRNNSVELPVCASFEKSCAGAIHTNQQETRERMNN